MLLQIAISLCCWCCMKSLCMQMAMYVRWFQYSWCWLGIWPARVGRSGERSRWWPPSSTQPSLSPRSSNFHLSTPSPILSAKPYHKYHLASFIRYLFPRWPSVDPASTWPTLRRRWQRTFPTGGRRWGGRTWAGSRRTWQTTWKKGLILNPDKKLVENQGLKQW